jgi:hypothetical protein
VTDEVRTDREAVLARACPELYAAFAAWRDKPLADYATHLYKAPTIPLLDAATVRESRSILAAELEPWARSQLAPAVADALLADVADRPVLQTGDHAELLVSPLNFATNSVAALGARGSARAAFVVNAASTVTLRTKAGVGPGLLQVGGTRFNLFGLPRRVLSGMSLYATGAARLEWRQSGEPLPTAEERVVATLRELTGDEVFPSAADAILTFNRRLWKHPGPLWSRGGLPEPLFTDDRLTATVVAAHIERGTLLARLLFSPDARNTFLRHRDASAGMIPNGTDFFSAVRGGRIVPLRLDLNADHGVCLREQPRVTGRDDHHQVFPFEPGEIARMLRAGRLVPDLVTGFAALSVLPAARALGGIRQSVYLPALARAVADALGGADRPAGSLYGWITGAWEPPVHPISILAHVPSPDPLGSALLDTVGGSPLGMTVGELVIAEFMRRTLPSMIPPSARIMKA